MTVKVLEGPIIRAGQALSEPLDCTLGQLVRIHMPSLWSPPAAPISFQISPDGERWYDLFNMMGMEVTVQSIVPGTAALIQLNQVRQVWVKFRSGWRANPQPQTEERVFSVAVEFADASAMSEPLQGTWTSMPTRKGEEI